MKFKRFTKPKFLKQVGRELLGTLQLDNVRLSALERDGRPMMILNDIEEVTVNGLRFPPTPQGPSIVMNHVRRQDIRDAGADLIEPQCQELTVAGPNGTDLVPAKPFSATATMSSGSARAPNWSCAARTGKRTRELSPS